MVRTYAPLSCLWGWLNVIYMTNQAATKKEISSLNDDIDIETTRTQNEL